ncbi:hypothetical protein KUTeg_022144 [Tegillarca granosa]|uniref:Uncharacterized protein n=1 Tax=Tegillarca granosa TaxID=220873 RepID=A0ABQ9EAU1_TEGGR|nr:hypothetical protein KUTeg_022144 [Tegillarca granosa]
MEPLLADLFHKGLKNFSDIDTVINFIQNELNESGQWHGYRMMWQSCRENGLNVRLNDVRVILRNLDPQGVFLKTSRCLRRRIYFASGPNFIWHKDG